MDVSETSVLPVIISKIKILLRKKQQTFFVRLEYLKKESFLFLHVTQKLGKYIFTDQVLIAMIMSFINISIIVPHGCLTDVRLHNRMSR